MRINARLDDSFEEKFNKIQEIRDINRTEILKEALDKYFSEILEREEKSALRDNQKIIELLGGTITGPKDGSQNYKKYMKAYLDDKFPDR